MTQQLAGRILKAIYSGAISFLGMLSTILTGPAHFSDVTDGQWTTILLFTLVAVGGTFGLAGWSGPSVNGGSGK
jgi:hypothetical protein